MSTTHQLCGADKRSTQQNPPTYKEANIEDDELNFIFIFICATIREGFLPTTSFSRGKFHKRIEIDSKRARVNSRVPAAVCYAAPEPASYSLFPCRIPQMRPQMCWGGPENPDLGALKAGPRQASVGDGANDGHEIVASIKTYSMLG